jgi:Transposase DDE domain
MLELETFLTTLYVMVDEFCHTVEPERHPGPQTGLSRSEVLTLALLARCRRFASGRDFYRFAERHLRSAFPKLPTRSWYNRLERRVRPLLEQLAVETAAQLGATESPFEALDRAPAPTRNAKRRGRGWLAGQADKGYSNRIGFFHGFGMLVSVHPQGAITGYGFGPASAKDQALAEVFFAARHQVGQGKAPCVANPDLPGETAVCLGSVGKPAERVYLADKGFQGPKTHARWRQQYGAEVIAPPQDNQVPAKHPWPAGLRRALAGMRQIVETVVGRLEHDFGLLEERPHTLEGFAARLAARVALHNLCFRINGQLGRPPLAFADLVDW